MIILSAQDNTLAPPDSSGAWECVGEWRNSSGVAIGPRHILAAAHTGDHVDATFRMDGIVYPAVGSRDVGPDLKLIEVAGRLPAWAEIYRGKEELEKPVLMIGFGCVRGEPVMSGEIQNGWHWGEHGKKSWGTNIVDEVMRKKVDGIKMHAIRCAMLAERGPTVGSYAAYDSGGGTFIRDGGRWKLAGINTSVDLTYTDKAGKQFRAAIWNAEGMQPAVPISSIAVRVGKYAEGIEEK